jgi:hypothetical protein
VRARDFKTPDGRQPTLRVFLSYRRDDASGHAGRLYDLLAARYGAERVFMDIDAIPLGTEFGAAIDRAVASCDVLIAVIGRSWLAAADASGHRRLDDPDDLVRREIESALAQDVAVVPTCVQGAEIPRAEDLPPSLASMTGRQGFQLSDTGWQDDVERLIRRLGAVGGEPPPAVEGTARPRRRARRPGGRILAALVLVAVLAALGGVLILRGGDGDGDTSDGSSRAQPSGLSRARGTVTLGSDLRRPPSDQRWYCEGSEVEPCTMAQTKLPDVDRPVVAPFDGVVTRWQVQAAGGPIRLIVLRGDVSPGDRSNLARVEASTEQTVRGEGRQQFPTRLPVKAGDAVGLQFSTGAYGNAPYAQGAVLEKWLPPLGPEQRPSGDSDSGADNVELLYNAFIERDRDNDGYGDASQDHCPTNPKSQKAC